VQLYRDMLEYVKDIVNLIRASPKRSALFVNMQASAMNVDSERWNFSKTSSRLSLRPLCPTRWTCRHESIRSVIDNYCELEQTLEQVAATDMSDSGTKAHGLQIQMQSFAFFFSLKTGLRIFESTELLSKTLQSKDMTVTGAVKAAEKTSQTIQHLRDDDTWATMWSSCINEAKRLNIEEPTLPRVRRPNHRFDQGSAPRTLTVEEHYRMVFFQLLDNILGSISSRLTQQNMLFYMNTEELILKAANTKVISLAPVDRQQYEASVTSVCQHFVNDLDLRSLTLQLDMLYDLVDGEVVKSIMDIAEIIRSLGPVRRLYSELTKLLVLMMVIPATSATAERSFSCLRRVQNFLRSTMSQERLNNLMILHIHQDLTDLLDLEAVARDFVSLNDSRRDLFGC
jgi:hypothetical protein